MILDLTHPFGSLLSLLVLSCSQGLLPFLGLFFMAFLVDFCLLDSLSFYLDFIVVLGRSGVLSHGADLFI